MQPPMNRITANNHATRQDFIAAVSSNVYRIAQASVGAFGIVGLGVWIDYTRRGVSMRALRGIELVQPGIAWLPHRLFDMRECDSTVEWLTQELMVDKEE